MQRYNREVITPASIKAFVEKDAVALEGRKLAISYVITVWAVRLVNIILLGLISYYYQIEFEVISTAGGLPILVIFSILMINSGMMVLAYLTILGCVAGPIISYVNGIGTWLFHPEHPLLFGYALLIIILNVLLLAFSIILLKSKAVNRFTTLVRGVSTGKFSEAAFAVDAADETADRTECSEANITEVEFQTQEVEPQDQWMGQGRIAPKAGSKILKNILGVIFIILVFIILSVAMWLMIIFVKALFSSNANAVTDSFSMIALLTSIIVASILAFFIIRRVKKKD